MFIFYLLILLNILIRNNFAQIQINTKLTKVWGPGLEADKIIMPARYFFIQPVNNNNNFLNVSLLGDSFEVNFDGTTNRLKPCRIWTNILDRNDGSYIVRYKLYEPCNNLKINILYNKTEHIAQSPYIIKNRVLSDDCDCPKYKIDEFIESWKCGKLPKQIEIDLKFLSQVNWDLIREDIIKKNDKPQAVSLCHYIIKNNEIYRKCYGKYVGFKMFMDSILLSLTRKTYLPDVEFFVNLGDWPLVTNNLDNFPVFSWCGSKDSLDIVMPTYQIVESTLENMGRVMLDMMSVQGNTPRPWSERIKKVFWRGRDSNRQRLDLINISRNYSHLFNVSLTNFFFFRDEEDEYGPKTDHVSFFSFFDYRYQLAIDGTVAAYRFPYLLAGGSLIFKQDSKYYEHFYNDLIPNVHYIPIKKDLSDLIEKIQWALDNDKKAQEIANNGKLFANKNLLSINIYCYYAQLLEEFSKRISNEIKVLDGMELVEQNIQHSYCDCNNNNLKDEL